MLYANRGGRETKVFGVALSYKFMQTMSQFLVSIAYCRQAKISTLHNEKQKGQVSVSWKHHYGNV